MPSDKTVLVITTPPHQPNELSVSVRLRKHLENHGFKVLTSMSEAQALDEKHAVEQTLRLALSSDGPTPFWNAQPQTQPWYRRFSKNKKY